MRTLTREDKRVLQIADKYVRNNLESRLAGAVLDPDWRSFHNAAATALAAYKPTKKKPRKGGK